MEKAGIDVLFVTDPANMNYLTGYDGWSFYVHQMVVLSLDEPEPVWIGRIPPTPDAEVAIHSEVHTLVQ